MVYDTLTSLVDSAKSVFNPRNQNDVNSFENYIFNNYITDMELEDEDHVDDNMNLSMNFLRHSNSSINSYNPKDKFANKSNSRRSSGEKKLQRISMIELTPHGRSEDGNYNLQRFSSMQ